MHVRYAQLKFTLRRETDYSALVSSTFPKDGLKPAVLIPVGFLLVIFRVLKEKTRDRYRCGLPCLLSPHLKVWILFAHNEAKLLFCLHAVQHFKQSIKSPLDYSQRAESNP
jgi:hypothetical protein